MPTQRDVWEEGGGGYLLYSPAPGCLRLRTHPVQLLLDLDEGLHRWGTLTLSSFLELL